MKKHRKSAQASAKSGQFQLRSGKIVGSERQIGRVFDLQVCLAPLDKIVIEVMNALENDRVPLLDERRDALDLPLDAIEKIDQPATTKRSASIRHWLSVGCQVIRWDMDHDFTEADRKRGAMAKYTNNSRQVLWPVGTSHTPVGPSALVGEIIINRDYFPTEADETGLNQLKCVVAHELTHVFDALKLIVPAFTNWRRFWSHVLKNGDACERAHIFQGIQALFADDYGSRNELLTIAHYWPAHAEGWFNALRADPKAMSVGK